MSKSKPKTRPLLVATPDEDAGLVPARDAPAHAQALANELAVTTTLRNPITDEVLAAFPPMPDFLNRKKNGITPEPVPHPIAAVALDNVAKALNGAELRPGTITVFLTGVRRIGDGYRNVRVEKLGRKWVTLSAGSKRARITRSKWNELTATDAKASHKENDMTLTTDSPKVTTRFKKAKVTKLPPAIAKGAYPSRKEAEKKIGKVARRKVAKASPKPKKAKGPTKADECVALALRAKGVSAAELNEATSWTGAPWKWLFQNPKKTGWADRRGLKFKVKEVDGTTRYFLTK